MWIRIKYKIKLPRCVAILCTALALNECPFKFRWLKLRRNYFMMGLLGLNRILSAKLIICYFISAVTLIDIINIRLALQIFESFIRLTDSSSKFLIPYSFAHEFANILNILKLTLRSNRFEKWLMCQNAAPKF